MNAALKLYVGSWFCDPKANECVTLKVGFSDNAFVRSARAPSNMKFVSWVARVIVSNGRDPEVKENKVMC